MKFVYPLCLVLLVLASCQDEKKETPLDRTKTDWPHFRLEGNVKTVSEKSFEALDNTWQKGQAMHEIASNHNTDLTFNEKGMLVLEKKWIGEGVPFEETKYNGRENMLSKTQYINGQPGIKTQQDRDKAGNITGIVRRNGDNSQLDRIAMTYNGKNLTEKKSFNGQDNPNDRIAYIYDKKGNMIIESMYLNTQDVQVRNKYDYDSQNRKISETRYSKDKMLYKTFYGYDGKNLVKKETTDDTGAIKYREKSKYDNKGNLLEHYTVDSYDQSITMDTYQYDNKGNMTSWTVTRNNKPEMQAVYTYDDHNNRISAKTSNDKGETVDMRAYTYEYDIQGNWIKKTVTLNGKPLVVAERSITYFSEEE